MEPKIASPELKIESPVRVNNRKPGSSIVRKILLSCGIISPLLYIAMCLFIPGLYEGYNSASQVVSELSAIGAPTRPLWFVLGTVYTLLIAAFGLGIRQSAGQSRALRSLGTLILASGIIGLAWSPMHQREVLAAGGGTFTDTWHLVMSGITLLLMLFIIGYGAAAFGKKFRLYSLASIVLFIVFGVLTGIEAPGVETNQPTPLIGVWERINIGVYTVWLMVVAIILLQREKADSRIKQGQAVDEFQNQRL